MFPALSATARSVDMAGMDDLSRAPSTALPTWMPGIMPGFRSAFDSSSATYSVSSGATNRPVRTTELLPLIEIASALVEDLDAIVARDRRRARVPSNQSRWSAAYSTRRVLIPFVPHDE